MATDDQTRAVLATVGANVAQLRTGTGMTQARLAEAIDCETSYLQKIEYGTATPSIQTLVRLAGALDVAIGVLFQPAKRRKTTLGRPPSSRR